MYMLRMQLRFIRLSKNVATDSYNERIKFLCAHLNNDLWKVPFKNAFKEYCISHSTFTL
jgi:hypothetical protein